MSAFVIVLTVLMTALLLAMHQPRLVHQPQWQKPCDDFVASEGAVCRRQIWIS